MSKFKSINMYIMLIILIIGVTDAFSGSSSEKELQASFDALEKDLKGISENAVDLMKTREKAFQKKMDAYKEEMDGKMDDLGEKLEKMTGKGKETIQDMNEVIR